MTVTVTCFCVGTSLQTVPGPCSLTGFGTQTLTVVVAGAQSPQPPPHPLPQPPQGLLHGLQQVLHPQSEWCFRWNKPPRPLLQQAEDPHVETGAQATTCCS